MENRQKNVKLDEENEKLFMDNLSKIDPELWRIKKKLIDLGINPALIPPIIEAIDQVNRGSGYGRVEIEIKEHKAIKCRGIDDRLLELELID